MDLTFQVLMQYFFCSIGFYFHHQLHPHFTDGKTEAQTRKPRILGSTHAARHVSTAHDRGLICPNPSPQLRDPAPSPTGLRARPSAHPRAAPRRYRPPSRRSAAEHPAREEPAIVSWLGQASQLPWRPPPFPRPAPLRRRR